MNESAVGRPASRRPGPAARRRARAPARCRPGSPRPSPRRPARAPRADSARDIRRPASAAVIRPASSSSRVSRPASSGGHRGASRPSVSCQRSRLVPSSSRPSPRAPRRRFEHGLLGRLVQGGHGSRQADADPGDHPGGDLAEPGRVGAADVAVPRAGQRRQRRHQVRDVGVHRRPVPDRREDGRQGVAEVGEQAVLGQRRQLVQGGRAGRDGGGPRGRPPRPWCPTCSPRSGPRRTRAASSAATSPGTSRSRPALPRRPPGHPEQGEPVQQPAAVQVGRLAQVEVESRGAGLRPQPQVPLLVPQVALQRHHRRGVGHRAELLGDHQPALDQLDGRSLPSQSTARAASVTSSRPASGRRAARRAPRPAGRPR